MRLSEWAGRAPHKDALAAKVQAVIVPVVTSMGAEADPSCWIAWGDDPAVRYTILAPTPAGLLQVHVRVNVPQEGPRTSGKLIRWSRVQTGELAVEMASGHRLLSFQVEGLVLRGSDQEADDIAAFALELFAAIDGRAFVPLVPATARPARGKVTPAAVVTPDPAVRRAAKEPRRLASPSEPGR
ncbi:MAG: hypothetical protein ACRDIL_15300 [Candidatus Limnocylindrales bacterium]